MHPEQPASIGDELILTLGRTADSNAVPATARTRRMPASFSCSSRSLRLQKMKLALAKRHEALVISSGRSHHLCARVFAFRQFH